MSWDVLLEDQFTVWLKAQEHAVQVEILANIKVLKISGSNLGRPYSDTLKGSRHSNMKELRVQCRGEPFRIAYAFDPQRSAIVLYGGSKKGVNEERFYKQLIRKADALFDEHLEALNH